MSAHGEFDKIESALREAEEYWNKYFKLNVGHEKYGSILEEVEKAKARFLTDEESQALRNCLCCRNCLPPIERIDGKMCLLPKCKFEPA